MGQTPVAECLRDVGALHRLRAGEIGDGAGHAQHPMITARRQPHGVCRIGQQALARGLRRRRLVEDLALRFRIGADVGAIVRSRWTLRAPATRSATAAVPSAGGIGRSLDSYRLMPIRMALRAP